MSDLRSFVRDVEARARQGGNPLSMSKLRDAITVALFDRTYAASIAAESAGTLEPIVLPPPHLARAAERYRIDASAFGFAFPAGGGAEEQGVRFEGGVNDFLIAHAKRSFDQSPGTLTRDVVRTLVQLGEVDLLEYVDWIGEHGDGADEEESAKDAVLDINLWIYDAGASTAEIESGVKAAYATLEALGVRPAQAYVAVMLAANDARHVAAHRDTWEQAELAACRACFDGWVTWPETAVLSAA